MDRTTRGPDTVGDCIKRMPLSLRRHYLSGQYPIFVLDFLGRFMSETDKIKMSEGQAYVALPYF